MYAPYEEGLPMINISTFSTNMCAPALSLLRSRASLPISFSARFLPPRVALPRCRSSHGSRLLHNRSLVEEADLDRAIAAFDVHVVRVPEEVADGEGGDEGGG